MASFTDLPETLASITIVNNINSDILAKKGQLKLLIQSNPNSLKSFHHNTNNLIDNQIHLQLLNTTQHGNMIDTNTTTKKILRPENINNNTHSGIHEIRSSSDESDPGLFTDQSLDNEEGIRDTTKKLRLPDAREEQVKCTLTTMKKSCELNKNASTGQAAALKKSDKMKHGSKILRRRVSMKKCILKPQNTQKVNKTFPTKANETVDNSRLIFKNKTSLNDIENKKMLDKKSKEGLGQMNGRISSHIIQRKVVEKDSTKPPQVCDAPPACDRLLSYSEMPPHLQFNPYITSGYRPILNVWGCLKSLCYVHNETVNIFTHGLPIIYILLTLPRTMPWYLQDARSRVLMWSHLAGATCPWLGSILYHLFMNCGSSCLVYRRLLQVDMFGIWISQSFGALPMLFASVHCLSYNIRLLVIASYCLCSIWGLRKALVATTPWSRRICFALPFMMRNLLCLLRLTKYGGGSPDSLMPTVLQDVMCILGGVIGAEKVPERWWPGSTDLCFNSHNIMHVLALLALYYNNRSSLRDIEWIRNTRTPCLAGSPL